jgi:hypothetical protein
MYKPDSTVYSLVMYEWATDINIIQAKALFDRFAALVGTNPDYATVCGPEKCNDYKYAWFNKREVINRQDWLDLGYLWLREEAVLSSFSVKCGVSIEHHKHMTFHIDEIAAPNARELILNWLEEVTDVLGPVYGYIDRMTYGRGPHWYVGGHGLGPDFPDEDRRRGDFGYIFGAKERHLDIMFRDIYPINLISDGHLALKIDGMLLADWIAQGRRGTLKKTGAHCWQWLIADTEIGHVRKTMLDAGHLIVTI